MGAFNNLDLLIDEVQLKVGIKGCQEVREEINRHFKREIEFDLLSPEAQAILVEWERIQQKKKNT